MLRAMLIYLSQAEWAQRFVTQSPFAARAASRFVAGETLDEAMAAVERLNRAGIYATLDHLGEHTKDVRAAETATQHALSLIRAVVQTRVGAGVSVKLSQLGANIDEDLCRNNIARIVDYAQREGVFVRIDMEESALVDLTLRVHSRLWAAGYHNVGVVIQSYLRRSNQDMEQLAEQAVPVRLVKGAYQEPPTVAFPRKADVDANFDRLADRLIHAAVESGAPTVSPDGRTPPIPAIATHDEARIAYARGAAERWRLPQESLEFQFLYGIRQELQRRLVEAGYPVRVYVPYGSEWYPYFMRRLAERPANLWFFLSNVLRR